jgi:Fe-S cluster assembly protein SufD
MTTLKEEHGTYLADLGQLEVASDPLAGVRRAAADRFGELGLPGPRDEEWRFTNLAPLKKVPFRLAGAGRDGLPLAKVEPLLREADGGQAIVFLNGHLVADHSRHDPEVVADLPTALGKHPERLSAHLARHARFERTPFTALNTAFLRDGVVVHVPAGRVVEEPIHMVYVSATAGEPTVSHPRALVVAGANSQVTVVESYVGPEGDVYFTNAVTEVVLGAGAVVDHYKVQRESTEAFHIATLQVQLGRAANFRSHLVSLGGALVRNEANAYLGGEGCECTLNGLALAGGHQLVDNHTRIDHAQAHCASHELYKHILDGRGHGVFNGKIFVHAGAQKTDAKQTNQTLLLSADAVIDTKPQLEIFADDVKCTHGATVGQLQDQQLFYLRSRGIGEAESRSLLTFAFANDIVERIRVRRVRAQLKEILLASQGLPRDEEES